MAEAGIVAGGVMDVNTALQEVLKTALIHNVITYGICIAAKAFHKCLAHLCVLASNCNELAEVLCAKHQINLIKTLEEWVGFNNWLRGGAVQNGWLQLGSG